MRRFAITDIHGQFSKFENVLSQVNFSDENDTLIVLGDVPDRGYNVAEVFQRLSTMKNLNYILGNHDLWCRDYVTGVLLPHEKRNWIGNGGQYAIDSINANNGSRIIIKSIYNNAVPYLVLDDTKLFVHGGIMKDKLLEEHSVYELSWDRDMIFDIVDNPHSIINVQSNIYPNIKEIFIGHTPTKFLRHTSTPLHIQNVWNIDTGAAYGGKLTLFNIDTYEYVQA